MPAGVQKQTAQERRKGESVSKPHDAHASSYLKFKPKALSEFADYVEREQAKRSVKGGSVAPSDSGYSTQSTQFDDHAELDILDTLDLAETSTQVRLKDLLLDTSDDADVTLQQLSDVLQKRMLEGHGETVFDLGQEDNGETMSFNKEQWDLSFGRLQRASKILRADCRVLMSRNVGGEEDVGPMSDKDTSCTGKILIRQNPETPEDVIETRIAVVGNVDAGKSTMLGVLVKGGLDDGRGKARVNLFRHKHEVESGRTSSVGMEIMGFDTMGDIVASNVPGRKLSWEEIGRRSAKVISFTDLAGHERYLRTTVFGLLSSSPNYCLLMVAANNGLIGMSK